MGGKSILIDDALRAAMAALSEKEALSLSRTGSDPSRFLPYASNYRRDKTSYYDPKFWSVVPDHLEYPEGTIVGTRDKLVPLEPTVSADAIIKPDNELMYRGMSADELAAFLRSQQIKSRGDYNMTGQEGLTYFTSDPSSAQYYANAFAPGEHKPNMERPAYIVAAKRPPSSSIVHVPGVAEHEIGVNVPIPVDDVKGIYRGTATEFDPGIQEKGLYSAPSAWLNWEEKSLDDIIKGRASGGRTGYAGKGRVVGDVVDQALKLVMGEGDEAVQAGIRAYHGSPHDYPAERLVSFPEGRTEYIVGHPDVLPELPEGATVVQDFPLGRMRMDKIGTGEGAQAYGHGLYTAEREGIAKSYRDTLSSNKFRYENVKPDDEAVRKFSERLADIDTRQKNLSDPEGFISLDSNSDELENLQAEKDKIKNMMIMDTVNRNPHLQHGRMYEVNINADPNTFLDWDKPLSEQPEAVRRLAGWTPEAEAEYRRASRSDTDALLAALEGESQYAPAKMPQPPEAILPFSATGDELHQKLFHQARRELEGKGASGAYSARVADKLREAGVPGIKYLDAGSRGAGDGTRNYVVFDDKLISIIRKYGIAGASVMAGYNIMERLDPKQALAATMADKDYQESRPNKAEGGEVTRDGYQTKGRVVNKGVEAALRIAREGLESLAKEKGKTLREIGEPFGGHLPRTPFEEWQYEFEPTSQLLERKPLDLTGLKEGDVFIPLVGDRTSNARKITSIGGKPLAFPTVTEGGPDYMRGPAQTKQGSVWASGQGIVTGLNDRLSRALRASEAAGYKDPNAYGVYVAMGPQGGDFSTHTSEAFMGMLPHSKILKKDAKEFDTKMRETLPDWPGILSDEAPNYIINAPTGDRRKAFIEQADKAYWAKKGFPDASLARYATTTPELVDAPTESAGYAIAKLDPTAPTVEPVVSHRTYPVPMQGTYAGSMPHGLMRDDVFTQFSRAYDENPAEPSRYVNAKRRSFGMDPDAFQVLEGKDIEDLIRKVTALKGEYADGGEVGDDDIHDALRIAKDAGGSTPVLMEDANGTQYDAQGNVIPQQERPDVIESGEPENYQTEVKPLIDYAMTPIDRPGMPSEPDLVNAMRVATQVAASGQPADARGDANWGRMRTEAVRRAMGAPESGASSPYQGPFSYNPSDMAAYVNTLVDFSPVALAEVAHDVPYEAGRTGDYGSAAVEGGLNALMTAPGMQAAGAAGKQAINFIRRNPKTVAALAGTAAATDPAQAQAGPARWFSKAMEVAQAIPMQKMTGEQALAMLRKGVSPEELRWTGTDTFLSGQKSVSKDDLLAHLAKNRVQTQDVVLGGNQPETRYGVTVDDDILSKYEGEFKAAEQEIAKARDLFWQHYDTPQETEYHKALNRAKSLPDEIRNRMLDEQVRRMGGLKRPTKYEDYSTEGGEGYQETLTVLGNKGVPRVVQQGNSWTLRDADNNPVMNSKGAPYWYYDKPDAERAARALYRESGKYKSSHWDDPDVLLHARSQVLDVTPPGANRPYKAWNVDEIQSDWGQDARKYGTLDPNVDWKEKYKEFARANTKAWVDLKSQEAFQKDPNIFNNDIEQAREMASILSQRIGASRIADDLGNKQQFEELYAKADSQIGAVAAAPYVGSTEGWTDLAIKKQLDKALDAGSDYFTWTPGDVHADRYNLSNFVDELHYSPSENKLYGRKGGTGVFEKEATPEELEKLIGEEPAKKLLSQPETESKWHSSPRQILTGIDMNIGGEGMRGYYDKVYPKRVQEVIRKATGDKPQIEVIEVQTADGPRKQFGVRLTDEMREKARFSDFNKGGRVTGGDTYDNDQAVAHALALTSEY